MSDLRELLSAPFPEDDVEWRTLRKSKDGAKAEVVAYIDARAVMNRLDDAVGPLGWHDTYRAGPGGGVLCALSLRSDTGEWVTKEDVAPPTDIEPIKGAVSDALRRAAVKWGIGRYLYDLPSRWVPIDQWGKFDKPTLATPQRTAQAQRGGSPATSPPVHPPAAAPNVDTRTGEIRKQPEWWATWRGWLIDNAVNAAEVEAVIEGKYTIPNIEAWIAGGDTRSINSLQSAILSARRVPVS